MKKSPLLSVLAGITLMGLIGFFLLGVFLAFLKLLKLTAWGHSTGQVTLAAAIALALSLAMLPIAKFFYRFARLEKESREFMQLAKQSFTRMRADLTFLKEESKERKDDLALAKADLQWIKHDIAAMKKKGTRTP